LNKYSYQEQEQILYSRYTGNLLAGIPS